MMVRVRAGGIQGEKENPVRRWSDGAGWGGRWWLRP